MWKIELARSRDERGWFVRTFDAPAFAALGLATHWELAGEAHNARAGTVRGLHFQRDPHGETKLIRCTHGAVYDVLADVRPGSPTYGRWEAFELREDADVALYAPAGIAHGYQTLGDDTVVHYVISAPYVPAAAAGFRYDSPSLAIAWPLAPSVISDRDRALPVFERSGIDA